MKNKMTVLLALAAFLTPICASAVNLQDAQTAWFDEIAVADNQIGAANVGKAVNLSFSGKTQAGAVAASTGAYVTISATAMTFYQPFATLDSSVGTAGVITYSSTLGSNTMGSLCDYINGLGKSYECQLLNAKRDDLPGVVLKTQTATDGTGNLAATGGLSVLNTTNTYVSLGITPAPGRRVVLKSCTVNGQSNSGGNAMYVYGQLRKFSSGFDTVGTATNDSYQVWKSSTIQDTDSTMPSATPIVNWLEFAKDAHVVVRAGLSGTASAAAQDADNFVRCIWGER